MSVIQHLFKITQFKSRPEEIPYSVNLLTMLFVTYALVDCFGVTPLLEKVILLKVQEPIKIQSNVFENLLHFVIATSASLLILHGLLKKVNKSERFVQSASNYLGACAFVHALFGIALSMTLYTVFDSLGFFLFLIFPFWMLATKIYVIKETFETTNLKAFGIVLLMTLLPFALINILNYVLNTG